MESEHGAAQEALAAAGEACSKAEEKNGRLVDEKLALVLELGSVKDEFATFWEKCGDPPPPPPPPLELGPTRLADPNRNLEDARLIILFYILLSIIFQKCRDPNLRLNQKGGSEPEPGLL